MTIWFKMAITQKLFVLEHSSFHHWKEKHLRYPPALIIFKVLFSLWCSPSSKTRSMILINISLPKYVVTARHIQMQTAANLEFFLDWKVNVQQRAILWYFYFSNKLILYQTTSFSYPSVGKNHPVKTYDFIKNLSPLPQWVTNDCVSASEKASRQVREWMRKQMEQVKVSKMLTRPNTQQHQSRAVGQWQ